MCIRDRLTTEDDYPIIVSVVPGGPAEKSGKINPDDKIVKVKQIQKVEVDSVDVVGWRIDEVVQLIRGEAGTQLELEIIPAKTEDLSDRKWVVPVSYTHLRAHETDSYLVCRLLLEKNLVGCGVVCWVWWCFCG